MRILVITAALLGDVFSVGRLCGNGSDAGEATEAVPRRYSQSASAYAEKQTLGTRTSTKELLHTLNRDLSQVETRIRSVEAYVTSEAFKVNREFRKL